MPNNTTLIFTDGMWLNLEDTGTLCGLSSRAMLKKISTIDIPKEKTRQVPCRNGLKWQIHVTALPPDAQAKWWDARTSESVKELTDAELDRQTEGPITRLANAEERAKEKAHKQARWTREFLALKTKRERICYAANHHLSVRTLYHWARKAKLSGAEPSASLYIALREHKRGLLEKWPKELVALAVETYLQPASPAASRVAAIVRDVATEKGWPVPARATVDRWLHDDNLVSPALANMARRGERAYRDLSEPVRTRDWSQIPVNGCWMGDHHELDLMVIMPDKRIVRPWMTSWLDAHSRLHAGYHLCETPSSDTIALALRHGILPKTEEGHVGEGVPESVLCDNGRDYKSHFLNGEVTSAFKQTEDLPVWGFFAELQIKRRWTKTYSARSKAPKERSYGLIDRKSVV